MIVVVARVIPQPDQREALIAVAQKVARASREEAGCHNYNLFQDTEDENAFVIVEEWEDDAALQHHFTLPHVAEFMQAMAPLLAAPPDARFHTVASTRDLSNVAGG